ncbi:hypothetical protein mEp044_17 [Escherichia phage mEp044]
MSLRSEKQISRNGGICSAVSHCYLMLMGCPPARSL